MSHQGWRYTGERSELGGVDAVKLIEEGRYIVLVLECQVLQLIRYGLSAVLGSKEVGFCGLHAHTGAAYYGIFQIRSIYPVSVPVFLNNSQSLSHIILLFKDRGVILPLSVSTIFSSVTVLFPVTSAAQ